MNKHVGSSCDSQAAAKSGCRDAVYDRNSVNSSTRKSSITNCRDFTGYGHRHRHLHRFPKRSWNEFFQGFHEFRAFPRNKEQQKYDTKKKSFTEEFHMLLVWGDREVFDRLCDIEIEGRNRAKHDTKTAGGDIWWGILVGDVFFTICVNTGKYLRSQITCIICKITPGLLVLQRMGAVGPLDAVDFYMWCRCWRHPWMKSHPWWCSWKSCHCNHQKWIQCQTQISNSSNSSNHRCTNL